MGDTVTDTRPVEILRKIPVELMLMEFDADGARRWAVVYAADVDGHDVSAAAIFTFSGGAETPQAAIEMAAKRPNALGF